MNLEHAVTKAPIPFDEVKAEDVRKEFSELPQPFVDLLAGTAGCSGYLAGLIQREGDWVREVSGQSPDHALANCHAAMTGETLAQISTNLRVQKHRAALLIALCDLGGVWTLDQVTDAITSTADCAVQAAISFLVKAEQARGKLPPTDLQDGGLFAIAMGKMGAHELNYSSDIDLIMLFNESAYPGDDYANIRRVFVRVTQAMVKMLSDNTADGYVYRTDLRLRPDPSVTPVCIGMAAAERYYEAHGRTWERGAMIKARIAAGDQKSGEEFLKSLAPFIWRKHLDFAAVQDAHDMRLRIRKHKGLGGPLTLPGHNVKLGRGGIREIEFFIQTQQLIHGGRDPSLRDLRTIDALKAGAAAGWVPAEMLDVLIPAYVAHRELEHRLQMLDDAQTHIYPSELDARRKVAAFCGAADFEAFETDLLARFSEVHRLTEAYFEPLTQEAPTDTAHWSGFDDPSKAKATADEWQHLPALRSPRAGEIFGRIEPKLSARLLDAPRPDEALVHFDVFLRGLPAGVQVFSLFESNPQILDLLVEICATAPRLAEYLGRNAGVLDAVLGQRFFEPLADADGLLDRLNTVLADETDYERILDASRRWLKEQKFRVGVQLLRRMITPTDAGAAYSALAEATLRAMLPAVIDEHARRFGAPPGQGAAVIAMGKLGSREMTESSDLDLIVIYEAARDELSDGPKPLAAAAYYPKLTQALISALTSQTAEGALYPVDMRLRPSGRQGPVATSLNGFREYQLNEAWTWEHLALTRARPIAGPKPLQDKVQAAICDVLAKPRDQAQILEDTRTMRGRLAEANVKAASDPWEVKLGPGRMLDIELLVQAGALITNLTNFNSPRDCIRRLAGVGWLTTADAIVLTETLDLFAAVQQVLRLALTGPFQPAGTGRGLWQLLFDVTGAVTPAALEASLAAAAADATLIVEKQLSDT